MHRITIQPGSLAALGEHVRAAASAHRCVVITDSNVKRHWGDAALAALRSAGLRADLISFGAGEANKTRDTWSLLTDQLLQLGVGRDAVIVALGGGVVGDVAGFVAATYMRGLPVVQVPTTLLAMIDASIGGKTGVDVPAGKNLVGAFHQPALVFIDTELLTTLPESELTNGMAEAVKHGAIADRSYFQSLLGSRDYPAIVAGSVRIKQSFVEQDPFEQGARAALNFGHTIGHALELASNYELPHGHAVAIGMVVEAQLGERLGITEPNTSLQLEHALGKIGLPTRPARAWAPLDTSLDKKARAGRTRFVLLARVGDVARGDGGAWTFEVDPSLVSAVIADTLRP
jgi:3-dehydroquinate synthase